MNRLLVLFLLSFTLIACQSTSNKRSAALNESIVEPTVEAPVAVLAFDVSVIDSLVKPVENEVPKTAATSSEKEIKKVVVKIPEDPIIINLLGLGNDALQREALLTPEDDNANMYFQAVLGRDPRNKDAQKGLAHIVDLYTDWALKTMKSGQHRASSKHMENAEFVNANDPLIAQTKKNIDDWRRGKNSRTQRIKQQKGDVNKFYLPSNLLTLGEDVVLQHLQPIIDRVEKETLRLAIYWPNDKGARFLYRVINSHVDEFRVRGMIHLRNTHVIEVKPN